MKIDILHGFGSNCKQGFQDSVSIISHSDEQQKLLYPIGKYFALKTMDSHDTRFITVNEQTQTILCMAVSPDRSKLALGCLFKDNVPFLAIYDIHEAFLHGEEPYLFKYSQSPNDQIRFMTFSKKARFLACYTETQELLFVDLNR